MLKRSSLCLYSSNLGIFWHKIEQFWPFEEISIFSHGSHLGYRMAADGHNFEREPPKDHFSKILFFLSKWFQTRRFLWEFPIGSYVKLSSAVAAILVGVLKRQTQFWKRTTQESFQQSLVEIGSVVSEEKIFFKFHPPFFLICIIGQNRQKFSL